MIKKIICIILFILIVVFVACSKDKQDIGGNMYITNAGFPEVNASAVSGDIIIAGSSTVYPLAERLADMFRDEGYADNIEVSSIGSGAGFERWAIQGETDIANASRPIKQTEAEAAWAIGRDPIIAFRVGTDALAVVVSRENTWVRDVTIEEIAQIFISEKWSDVNPDWPDNNILKFSPGTDSGTFDYFIETVFDKEKEPLLTASNVQFSEDDNILSRGVQGNKYAIGYFGYAYYEEQVDNLIALKINTIEANLESVDNNTYPLARPLFMYSSKNIMKEKPQVAAFLAYVLTNVRDIIVDVGYFPAHDSVIDQAKQQWLEITKEE